jgi:hypothetical protein
VENGKGANRVCDDFEPWWAQDRQCVNCGHDAGEHVSDEFIETSRRLMQKNAAVLRRLADCC